MSHTKEKVMEMCKERSKKADVENQAVQETYIGLIIKTSLLQVKYSLLPCLQ